MSWMGVSSDMAARRASPVLWCVRHNWAREGILLGYRHLNCCLQVWVPQQKKDLKIRSVQRSAIKMVKYPEGKMYEKRLTSLGLFSLKETGESTWQSIASSWGEEKGWTLSSSLWYPVCRARSWTQCSLWLPFHPTQHFLWLCDSVKYKQRDTCKESYSVMFKCI